MSGSLINNDNFALEPMALSGEYITESITISTSWSSNTQNVSIYDAIGGITPLPFCLYTVNIPPEDTQKWAEYGVYAEGLYAVSGVIVFKCTTVPAEALTFTLTVTPMTSIGGMSGEEYTLTGYNGSGSTVAILDGIKTIGANVFKNNTDITTLDLSKCAALLHRINDEAFKGCTALSTIVGDIPIVVKTSAFEGCTSLTSVTFAGGTHMISAYAFKNCTSLTSITFPDDCEVQKNMFIGCTAVTSVIFGSEYKTENSDLSFTDALTQTCLNNIVDKLYDYSSGAAHTLTVGATNKARITAERLSAAAAKNWTVN